LIDASLRCTLVSRLALSFSDQSRSSTYFDGVGDSTSAIVGCVTYVLGMKKEILGRGGEVVGTCRSKTRVVFGGFVQIR
jgi:hypothetical protein